MKLNTFLKSGLSVVVFFLCSFSPPTGIESGWANQVKWVEVHEAKQKVAYKHIKEELKESKYKKVLLNKQGHQTFLQNGLCICFYLVFIKLRTLE